MATSAKEFGEHDFRSLARAVALEGRETIAWGSAWSEHLVKRRWFSQKRTPQRTHLFDGCLLFSRPVSFMQSYGDSPLGRTLRAEWKTYSEIWLRKDGDVIHTEFHDGDRFAILEKSDLAPIARWRTTPKIATVGELLCADLVYKRGRVGGSSTHPFVEWELQSRRTGDPWSIREPLEFMQAQIRGKAPRVEAKPLPLFERYLD